MVRLPGGLLPMAQALQHMESKLPRRRPGAIATKRVAFIDSWVVGEEFRRQRIAESL